MKSVYDIGGMPINDYKPLRSEGLYDKKILKEYVDSRETDFIYVPKTSLWDVSKITDLTMYFPHLIGNY